MLISFDGVQTKTNTSFEIILEIFKDENIRKVTSWHVMAFSYALKPMSPLELTVKLSL